MKMGAEISPCGRYRFTLSRIWDDRPLLAVVMFNPSTADHTVNDPTIKLLMEIASHNGFGGILVSNLCPLRSSTPRPAIDMLKAAQVDLPNPVGREVLWQNIEYMADHVRAADAVLIAWGSMGGRAGSWYSCAMQNIRDRAGLKKPIYRLGVCQNGHPMHPLARGKNKIPKTAPLLPC